MLFSKWHIFWFLNFVFFVHNSLQKPFQYKMFGVFWKIQEICNKMGTRICKIVQEMSEIIEPKVGNPKNSVSRNWAILSHPWNLTFFEDEIFQLFPYLYGSKVPKWNFAHILLWKKVKNIRKTPKNTWFTAPWLKTTLLNDPVYVFRTASYI